MINFVSNDKITVNPQTAGLIVSTILSPQELENINNTVFYIKLGSLVIVSVISLLFGCLPYLW